MLGLYQSEIKGGEWVIDAPHRRREIVEILFSTNGKVKINDLAARFGVSRRTIRTDVEVLSQLYPIVSYPGRCGGVGVDPPIHNRPRFLDHEETAALLRILAYIPEQERVYIRSILRDLARIDSK